MNRRIVIFAGLLFIVVTIMTVALAHAQTSPSLVPTGLTATFVRPAEVDVSWNPPTNATSVAGYNIYRNGALIANPINYPYVDHIVFEGTYVYTVAAYASSGIAFPPSLPSKPVQVTFDVTPPTTPTGLNVTALTSSSVTLSWNAATDDVGVVGYYIVKAASRLNTPNPITGTTYTDRALSAETTYPYQIEAYDIAQNVSVASPALNVKTLAAAVTISPAFNSKAFTVSTSEIDLAWGPSTDSFGTPAYYIYRDGLLATSTTVLSYQDKGLPAGKSYQYYLISFDAAGNLSARTDLFGTSTLPGPVVTSTPVYVPLPGVPLAQIVSTPAGSSSSTSTAMAVVSGSLTSTLAPGSHGDAVKLLQSILVAQGYLGVKFVTGTFGTMTQLALQQFQCDQNIVCSGNPSATGWGSVEQRRGKF